jgi:NhaP-type Na+/H+ or K+/H+ antiporter
MRQMPSGAYKKALILVIAGGLAFWAATIAISLTPIAAEYRAAEAIPNIQTVWAGGLIIGMIIGCLLSYFLVRFFDKIPTKNPILKSVALSFIALIIVLILIEVPASFGTGNALYWFLIGVVLNLPRFLVLGIVVGYLQMLYSSGVAKK